jgi:hypothetical protein
LAYETVLRRMPLGGFDSFSSTSPFGVMKRQRLKQHALPDAEDHRVDTDRERQAGGGHSGERHIQAERANGERRSWISTAS